MSQQTDLFQQMLSELQKLNSHFLSQGPPVTNTVFRTVVILGIGVLLGVVGNLVIG